MKKKLVPMLLGSAITLAGCAGMQDNPMFSKENLGTVIGVGAGALLGSQVGGGDGRKLAILAGALAGGYLGKTIGARLDERDRQALAAQTTNALNASQDGQTINWRSEHSGATARITPVATETRTQQTSMKRTARVQQVNNLALLNQAYQTTAGVNIRSAPSTNGERIGSLAKGTSFTALGRTENNWIAVGRQGVTVGYIHAPLTQPVQATVAKADTATDLDSMVINPNDSNLAAFNLDDMDLVTEQVAATTQCRTLKYEVTAGGSTDTAQTKACQSADGAWELI